MKMDILPIEDFIKANDLQPVSNPVSLDATGVPTPDGIFSYVIFGYSAVDRKGTFAYIDLNGTFLLPQVVKTLSRLGSPGKILNGSKYGLVVNGKILSFPLTPDTKTKYPDAQTGLDFYIDNWDAIDWLHATEKDDDAKPSLMTASDDEDDEEDEGEDDDEDDALTSIEKTSRLKYLSLVKKQAFITKVLVLPAYYRDFNSQDMTLGDDINKVYNRLISQCKTLKSGFGLSMFNDAARRNVQNIIGMLYEMTMTPVSGKTVDIDTGEAVGMAKSSMLRRNLIGRSVDYSAYSVITAPLPSTVEKPDDYIGFNETDNPLQSVLAMYRPFFEKEVSDDITTIAQHVRALYGSHIKYIDPSQWSTFEINRVLDRMTNTGEGKELPVTVSFTDTDGKQQTYSPMIFLSEDGKDAGSNPHPLTWLDLLYVAAVDITKDKYEIETRYPVANYNNLCPAKTEVSSTNKTYATYVKIPDIPTYSQYTYFPKYPYVDLSAFITDEKTLKDFKKIPPSYFDLYRVTIIGNAVIKQLNADYDGDMLFFRGLFTKEANAEAENSAWGPTNFFNPDGKLSRNMTNIGKDICLGMYELTKD